MVWLGGLITLLTIVLWVYAFFDALTCPAEEVRNLPKVIWLLVIVLFAVIGPLLWLFLGRPITHPGTAVSSSVPVSSADHLDPRISTGRPGATVHWAQTTTPSSCATRQTHQPGGLSTHGMVKARPE